MSDFFDVVTRQRAHRRFSDTPLDDADVARVLEAATYAPSAENRQPWVFVVVRDPDLRAQILDLTEKAWAGGGRAFAEQRLDKQLLDDVDQGIAGGGYRSAPVLVVVAVDLQRGLEETVASSIFPAVQNLLLAATAIGLGSALTTITMAFGDEIGTLLDLPATVRPEGVIPLGHPAKPLGKPKREPFGEHTHRDRYGNSW